MFTSAGVTSGIDLALAIIRRDGGHRAALEVARELVVQLRRTGGQSQYALHIAGQIAGPDAFSCLIETVISEPGRRWTLDDMAAEAGMNRRTLTRHFKAHLAISAARFIERTRVDHARSLLEAELPLKRVAREAGFGDLQRMRRAFQRRYGVSIAEYLATFGNEAVGRYANSCATIARSAPAIEHAAIADLSEIRERERSKGPNAALALRSTEATIHRDRIIVHSGSERSIAA
ncbi:GlxA family transcriptional regulator [Palleronia sp.]|uniref:GlxA family transcriptional regulator n=1 Tax=Palleronia sp. TaxID=1940284 RepID=UPI0035C78F89